MLKRIAVVTGGWRKFCARALDDVLARLITFPNVIATSHQAFLTHEALATIAEVTLENATAFERGQPLENRVRAVDVLPP